MHQITVISLGAGHRDQLTLGALDAMKKAKRLILRTGETDAAAFLREQGLQFETLDALHEESEDFDAFIAAAAEQVKRAAARTNMVYAVLDATDDETVAALMRLYPDNVHMGAGMPLYAPLLQAAGAQLPARICSATSLTVPSTQDGLLVTEMNTRQLAGECKLKLSGWYGDEMQVLFFPPAKTSKREFIRIPLYEIDRQMRYDHTAAVYLPPVELMKRERYDLWDLARVLRRLRGENGCPWDRQQTHETLSRYLIEEAYETAQAVHEEDWEHVAEELGDVLLQVFFQSDIGAQYGTFELSDVTTSICRKMLARHTHIFGSTHCDTAEEVAQSWEKLKQEQRGNRTVSAVLADVSADLPALLRAEKMLKKLDANHLDYQALLGDDPALPLLRDVEKLRKESVCAEECLHLALCRLIASAAEAENAANSQENQLKT